MIYDFIANFGILYFRSFNGSTNARNLFYMHISDKEWFGSKNFNKPNDLWKSYCF